MSLFSKIRISFRTFFNFPREEFESIHLFIKMIFIDWYYNFLILCEAKKHMMLMYIFEKYQRTECSYIFYFKTRYRKHFVVSSSLKNYSRYFFGIIQRLKERCQRYERASSEMEYFIYKYINPP